MALNRNFTRSLRAQLDTFAADGVYKRLLHLESPQGARARIEGYGDTTIKVRLDEAVEARIYQEIVDSEFFRLAPAEEEERLDTHGPCGLVEFCAASDASQRCDWWDRSENYSSPARAKFTQVLDEIRSLLVGSPEYRALPPLPRGL